MWRGNRMVQSEIVVVGADGTEAAKIDPTRLARDVGRIRDAFHLVLNEDDQTMSFRASEVDVGLSVSAEGNLGVVKGSATASINIKFVRREN